MTTPTPRLRFAPSPTGYLHIGGLRTALYNALSARQQQGVLILRIEDTDRARFVEGAEAKLIETLTWAGLTFDEGPHIGGTYGPYRQSERLDVYKKYARALIERGGAYVCTCNEAARKGNVDYSAGPGEVRHEPNCQLVGGVKEFDELIAAQKAFVVRLRVPAKRPIVFTDLVRKKVKILSDVLDDQILLKSDGFPTYHLASVVDDHLMQITHVIRGEEWLPSTPKHILLYEYFGWELPQFAHLPLLLNKDRAKLSKRQGDVSVESHRDKGYLKDALINFVALLGWNPGDNREVLSYNELVQDFRIEKVHKAGAIVDYDKLNWLNGVYIKQLPKETFVKLAQPFVVQSKHNLSALAPAMVERAIANTQERVQLFSDVADAIAAFLVTQLDYDGSALIWKKSDVPTTQRALAAAANYVRTASEASLSDPQISEADLKTLMTQEGMQPGDFFWPLRYALSGLDRSPSVFELLAILGREESLRRITVAQEKIGVLS